MKVKKDHIQNKIIINHISRFLGYKFKNIDLLTQSLTHSIKKSEFSILNNQRLEFLGDRVLGLIIAEIIYYKFLKENEGQLAKRFSELVSKKILVKISKKIELEKLIIMKNSIKKSQITDSIIADVLEALICAIYIDSNFGEVRKIISSLWLSEIEQQINPPDNPKSKLQEWCLANKIQIPEYIVISKEGPDHKPQFTVELTIEKYFSYIAKGNSIQDAEIKIARYFLKKLND